MGSMLLVLSSLFTTTSQFLRASVGYLRTLVSMTGGILHLHGEPTHHRQKAKKMKFPQQYPTVKFQQEVHNVSG